MAYHAIHDNVKIINRVLPEDMRTYLSSKTLSMNSKTPVKPGFWNKYKGKRLKQTYSYIKFSEKHGNIFDVHTLTEKAPKNIDLLTYSFPCQDLSIQGKSKGIVKGNRSGLLFEIERYIKNTKKTDLPEFLLMENVKALSFKRHRQAFEDWKKFLKSQGYKTTVKIYKSSDFGSPQGRERVFALSYRTKKVELQETPKTNPSKQRVIKDILDSKVNNKYILNNLKKYKLSKYQEDRGKHKIKRACLERYTSFASETYIYDKNHIGPTLTASGANSRIKMEYGKKTNTLDSKIRMLNPREAYRYMGFSEADYKKVNKLKWLTDSQIIFTAGNSISIEVLEFIFKGLL